MATIPTPRVIGINDWAWRRGKRYGTLVVDLERRRPIALLPDHQAATVAAWLRRIPASRSLPAIVRAPTPTASVEAH